MSTSLHGQSIRHQPATTPASPKHIVSLPAPRVRENNFGALRLFAALLVIYGHGQDLKGLPTPILWNVPIATIGLDIFFSLSGYLIYDSWLRDPRLGSFLIKRALRIFPGLAVCVLACICIIGPIATDLPISVYFAHHATWQFLLNIALYLKLYLPGVFTHRLLFGAVNGSLWSLFPETLCYLAVPLVWLWAAWGRGALLLVVMGLCGAGGLYMFAYHPTGYRLIYSADPKYILVQVPFFMAGAFWRQLQTRFAALFRLDLALIFCSSTFLLPSLTATGSIPFQWLTLSYGIIAFGSQATPLLHYATRFGDLSYGSYLYAFPIQQLVLDHTHRFTITIATVVTLMAAVLSWHLVERPALRLKPRVGWRPPAALGLDSTVAPSARASLASGANWRSRGRAALWLAGETALLPGMVTLLGLAAYAGQIGLGHWQTDEYLLFAGLRDHGWQAVASHLALSPLPFAEGLLGLYGTAVIAFNSPLVIPFLALLWAGMLACMALAAAYAFPASRQRLVTAAVLAAALFTFVLATNPVTEVFYWPAGAASYLPTGGSAVVLLFLLCRPASARVRLGCAIALLVAATSSELGAALTVGFAVAALCSGAMGGRPANLGRTLREGLWWLVPAAFGIAVLGIRAHQGLRFDATAINSVADGARLFGIGLAARLLFAFGFAAFWQKVDPVWAVPGRWHGVLAVALGTAVAFSIIADGTYAGVLTTRSWLEDLLAIIVVGWLLARWPWWRRFPWLPPVALALALLPVLSTLPGLNRDYANYGWATSARVRTWRSASTPGTNQMEFYLPPDEAGMLIRGDRQAIGRFRVGPEASEQITAVGRFFHKDIVVTCQPWQTDQSWLINGQFIPACPPHPGPPDRTLP